MLDDCDDHALHGEAPLRISSRRGVTILVTVMMMGEIYGYSGEAAVQRLLRPGRRRPKTLPFPLWLP